MNSVEYKPSKEHFVKLKDYIELLIILFIIYYWLC